VRAVLLFLLLAGCSTTTVITDQSGKTFQVESQKDAVVTFKDKTVEVSVDNRGKPSTLDELIKLYFMQWQAEQSKEE
jgi:hypothetical protein